MQPFSDSLRREWDQFVTQLSARSLSAASQGAAIQQLRKSLQDLLALFPDEAVAQPRAPSRLERDIVRRLAERRLYKLFDVNDPQHTGTIGVPELRRILQRLDIQASDAEVRAMVGGFDADHCGRFHYQTMLDFVHTFMHDDRLDVDVMVPSRFVPTTSGVLGGRHLDDTRFHFLVNTLRNLLYRHTQAGHQTDLFLKMDLRRDGKLSLDELQCALRGMGVTEALCTTEELAQVLRRFAHPDHPSYLDVADFCAFVTGVRQSQPPEWRPLSGRRRAMPVHLRDDQDVDAALRVLATHLPSRSLREAFLEFDLVGDGVISLTEFSEVMERHGVAMDPGIAQRILQRFDRDRSGRLSYSEFLDFLKVIAGARQREEELDERSRRAVTWGADAVPSSYAGRAGVSGELATDASPARGAPGATGPWRADEFDEFPVLDNGVGTRKRDAMESAREALRQLGNAVAACGGAKRAFESWNESGTHRLTWPELRAGLEKRGVELSRPVLAGLLGASRVKADWKQGLTLSDFVRVLALACKELDVEDDDGRVASGEPAPVTGVASA